MIKIKVINGFEVHTKLCTVCALEKPIYMFPKSKSSSDGLKYCCSTCNSAFTKKSRMVHEPIRKKQVEELKKRISEEERILWTIDE